ncbi:MAG: adenylate/guanylate cyclase domain-containing protein [Erythrobacter sp.]
MDRAKGGNFIKKGWRNVREAGPQRLVLTGLLVLIALLIARFAWSIPFFEDAERGLYDFRDYYTAEKSETDEEVMLVVYDDQTLTETRQRSPLDRGTLVDALKTLDTMGLKAIGIDILFDSPQDEDAELIATLKAMKTPTAVAYMLQEVNPDDITYDQQIYLDDFMAELAGSNAFPASVRLNKDAGVTRVFAPPPTGDEPELISRAMLIAAGDGDKVLPGYQGAIDFQHCKRCGKKAEEELEAELAAEEEEGAGIEPLYNSLPITLFTDPEIAAAVTSEYSIEGKYVLIGADVVDTDRVPTSLTTFSDNPVAGPGVAVHADKVSQMLDGRALDAIASWQIWLLTALMIVMAVLTGLLEFVGNWRIYPILAAQAVALIAVPFLLHQAGVDTFALPAVGWVAGWMIAFSAVTSAARASGAVQRNFAQGALGKYLPREMAQEIIDKPDLLALHGEKKEIYVMFSDLEGFTKMSHAISPEMVAKLLNRYLEMLSEVVLDHGGVIDKFVGDAVVAFWGAPIAKADDADRAARAGYAIWEAGEAFRAEVAAMDPNLPKIGKTRVGMHFGEAVVGNFGGESRIQYTALGDSMNTAARLEAANKALETSVMASRDFAERTTLNWWRPMGRVVLRGRARPVELMEPAPDFSAEDRAKLEQAIALVSTRRNKTIEVLEELIGQDLSDKALENLLNRIHNLNEEDAYVLG